MVWIKWDDYGKKPKQKKKIKKKKRRIEPPVRIIPGKHRAEFIKASELLNND
jgi:hypothetical protein